MKKNQLLSVLFCFILGFVFGQVKCIDSCITSDGFCGTYLKVYSDSSFIYCSGCEQYQAIRVGKLVSLDDTIKVKRCSMNFSSFIDSVVFVQLKHNSDSIDIFYFDKEGRTSFSEGDIISYSDSSEKWILDSNFDLRHHYSPELIRYSRDAESFKNTGEFLAENDFYYNVDESYLSKNERKKQFVFIDYYTWTGIKRVMDIPPNTRFVKIYYHLPNEIISVLNLYSVKLRNSENCELSCGNRVIKID